MSFPSFMSQNPGEIELVEPILPIVIFVIIYYETILHLFCECEKSPPPLWDELCFLINNVSGETFTFSNL